MRFDSKRKQDWGATLGTLLVEQRPGRTIRSAGGNYSLAIATHRG
jgi:hypothetical protein